MSLTDFFRINLPCGIKKSSSGEWFAFNRKYVPLGWNSTRNSESIYEQNHMQSILFIRTSKFDRWLYIEYR